MRHLLLLPKYTSIYTIIDLASIHGLETTSDGCKDKPFSMVRLRKKLHRATRWIFDT
jgi:hypothetical protein